MFAEGYGGRSMKKENNDVLSDELLWLAAKQFADEEGEKYYKAALELNTQNLEMPTEAQLSKFKKICAKEFRKKKYNIEDLLLCEYFCGFRSCNAPVYY